MLFLLIFKALVETNQLLVKALGGPSQTRMLALLQAALCGPQTLPKLAAAAKDWFKYINKV